MHEPDLRVDVELAPQGAQGRGELLRLAVDADPRAVDEDLGRGACALLVLDGVLMVLVFVLLIWSWC